MLSTRVIPCLDVHNGRTVKGVNFNDLVDAGDPVEQAKIYSDSGADEICFLDITASNENRDIIYDVVEKTSKKCFVPLTVGGGVRRIDDINKLLDCGADKVSINTAAVQNSEVVVESSKKFGSQFIVVAIDDKKIVGCITLLIEQKFIHDGGLVGHIEDVVVRKDYEGKGIGMKLVTSMLEYAKRKNCYKTILDCKDDVKQFYERIGFKHESNGMRYDHV